MSAKQLITVVTIIEYEPVQAEYDQCGKCAFNDNESLNRLICRHYADCLPSIVYQERFKTVTIHRGRN